MSDSSSTNSNNPEVGIEMSPTTAGAINSPSTVIQIENEANSALQGPLIEKKTFKRVKSKTQKEMEELLTTKEGWKKTLHTLIPITSWLPSYDWRHNLFGDINAGVTVGVMLVPQSMAYAQLAGLPYVYGLYAALLPIFVYAFLGTSRQLSVGPVSVVSLLISTTCSTIVDPAADKTTYIHLAISMAFMSGAINAILGVLRLGFIVKLMSPALITGFMSASSIIIFCSQLASFFGVTVPKSDYFWLNIYNVAKALPHTSWLAVLLGTVFFVVVFPLQNWKAKYPWALGMIIIETIISYLVHHYAPHIALPIVKDIPEGLPTPFIPNVPSELLIRAIPGAFIVAFVGFAESISIAKKYAAEEKYNFLNASQELLALGLANIVGAFFQAYPVTGSFSRTAVKFNTGSKSQVSAMVVGIVVMCTLLFLTPLFYYIPKTTLASIVLCAVVKLFEWHKFVSYWKISKIDFAVAVVTLLVCLGAGVEIGIGSGIGVSLLALIYETSRPHTAELGNIGGKIAPNYRNIKRNKEYKLIDHVVIARVDAAIIFPNASYVQDKLEKYLIKTDALQPIRVYILECATVSDLDFGGLDVLKLFKEDLDRKHIRLLLVGVRGRVADILRRDGFEKIVGENNFFHTVAEAVEATKVIIPQLEEEEAVRNEQLAKEEEERKQREANKPKGRFYFITKYFD